MTVLGLTGYLIGHPVHVQMAQEASFQYGFGTVRFLHFLAGYVFVVNFLARIYWGFAGNRYANWAEFIPTTRACWREIKEVLRVDVFQTQELSPQVAAAVPVAAARIRAEWAATASQ